MTSFHQRWSKRLTLPMGQNWDTHSADRFGVAGALCWTVHPPTETRRVYTPQPPEHERPPTKRAKSACTQVHLDRDVNDFAASRQSGTFKIRPIGDRKQTPSIHEPTLEQAVQYSASHNRGDMVEKPGPALTNGYRRYPYEKAENGWTANSLRTRREEDNYIVCTKRSVPAATEVVTAEEMYRRHSGQARVHSADVRAATRSALSRSGAQAPTPVSGSRRPYSAHPRAIYAGENVKNTAVYQREEGEEVVTRLRPKSAHPGLETVGNEVSARAPTVSRSVELKAPAVQPDLTITTRETRDVGVDVSQQTRDVAVDARHSKQSCLKATDRNGNMAETSRSNPRLSRPWSTYENDYNYPKHVGIGTWIDRDGNKIRQPAKKNSNITMTKSAILRAEANGVNYFKQPSYTYWRMERFANAKPTLNTHWSEDELARIAHAQRQKNSNVNVQLDCPDNSNMTVTLNVKTGRNK